MTLGASRIDWHLSRVLKRKLAVLRYGEEQVGWEKSKSEGATAVANGSLSREIART